MGDLLPRYLNFVKGVVDSDDLPLNVSREQLQQSKIMKVISKKLVRKVLELMKKLAKEEDSGDDEDEDKDISLDKYLDRMQESQESIYYMSGDSMEVMKKAPALQVFKKKDIEVLMLADHLDEPCLQKLADYEGKKFVS